MGSLGNRSKVVNIVGLVFTVYVCVCTLTFLPVDRVKEEVVLSDTR